jgi:hypothetical protein
MMEEGGKSPPIFGLGLRSGERAPQQQLDDEEPRRIFGIGLKVALRGNRRRGAPVRWWRKKLREPMLAIMAKFSDASGAEIARRLEVELGQSENIDVRTLQNWLSMIKRGRRGYGRGS